jgi:shikimate kinase
MSDDIITLPKCSEDLSPILAVIPLQLFAYTIADLLGCDVDQPRNWPKVSLLNKPIDANIILIGGMGSGKSTVGLALASKTQRSFYDTDTMIESLTNTSISELFKVYGDAYFRTQEHTVYQKIKTLKNSIIATGGGFPLIPKHRPRLPELGLIVYLYVPCETMISRVQDDPTRPLAKDQDTLRRLWSQRHWQTSHSIQGFSPWMKLFVPF